MGKIMIAWIKNFLSLLAYQTTREKTIFFSFLFIFYHLSFFFSSNFLSKVLEQIPNTRKCHALSNNTSLIYIYSRASTVTLLQVLIFDSTYLQTNTSFCYNENFKKKRKEKKEIDIQLHPHFGSLLFKLGITKTHIPKITPSPQTMNYLRSKILMDHFSQ